MTRDFVAIGFSCPRLEISCVPQVVSLWAINRACVTAEELVIAAKPTSVGKIFENFCLHGVLWDYRFARVLVKRVVELLEIVLKTM